MLVVNPAVPPWHAAWPAVRASGCRVTTEFNLLVEAIGRRPVVAVTGSNGKSTVAAWTARLLNTDAVGGNFECGLWGLPPLLDRVSELPDDQTVVLEVSSFQLARLADTPLRPVAAAVTNVSANHLDWHASFADYLRAKQRLLEVCDGVRVLPADGEDPLHAAMAGQPRTVTAQAAGPVEWPRVRRLNAGVTRALVEAAGGTATDTELAAAYNAEGTHPVRLPHRGRIVHETDGLTFVDDSAATSPEAVLATLEPTAAGRVLIAGGRNKGFDIDAFARSLVPLCEAVATIGETASELAGRVAVHGGKVRSHRTITAAVKWAAKVCPRPGEVRLTPGMASTDQFADYRQRGVAFADAVAGLRPKPKP